MERLDRVQAQMIYDAEIAHFKGFRSSTIVGERIENLLIDKLRRLFPKLKFGKGNIIPENEIEEDGFVKVRSRGKGNARPQTDIIIFRKGIFEDHNYSTVKENEVVLAIEVKKWLNPKDYEKYTEGNQARLWKKHYPQIPRLIVGFRIRNSERFSLKTVDNENTFVFSVLHKKEGWASKSKQCQSRYTNPVTRLLACSSSRSS
jgi:hypothetical protein